MEGLYETYLLFSPDAADGLASSCLTLLFILLHNYNSTNYIIQCPTPLLHGIVTADDYDIIHAKLFNPKLL